MSVPITPSWHYDHGEGCPRLLLWDRYGLDKEPDAVVSGPMADKLLTVLSWVAGQSMYRDPEPEPEPDLAENLAEWKRSLTAVASDITDAVERLNMLAGDA